MAFFDNAFALVVGISEYEGVSSLPQTVLQDARDIHATLVDPVQCNYNPANVKLLLNKEATVAALRTSLADLATSANADAQVFIYFSGHGARIDTRIDKVEYLLPCDADISSIQGLKNSTISGAELSELLRAIPARKLLAIFDCCHAAGIGQLKNAVAGPPLKAGLAEQLYDSLKSGKGRAIISSSRSEEVSWVMPNDNNSLFTKHLLAGMRGGILSADGLIRVFDLFEYLQPKVTVEQSNQHPVLKADLEQNFPIAMRLGGQKSPIPTDDQGFRYAAYVSFADNEADRNWVWKTLVPRLEAAGLSIAVSGDVEEPGVALIVGVERAMEQSKRTIAVLSPGYLTDAARTFDNIMAQTMGIRGGTFRLIPVKIAPCEDRHIPIRLSQLVALDFTTADRVEQKFSRLIAALKGPIPRI